MDPVWMKVLEQVPGLGVLVWVVMYFLTHMKQVAEIVREDDRRNAEMLREVLNKNTAQLERNTELLGRNTHALDKHPIHQKNGALCNER